MHRFLPHSLNVFIAVNLISQLSGIGFAVFSPMAAPVALGYGIAGGFALATSLSALNTTIKIGLRLNEMFDNSKKEKEQAEKGRIAWLQREKNLEAQKQQDKNNSVVSMDSIKCILGHNGLSPAADFLSIQNHKSQKDESTPLSNEATNHQHDNKRTNESVRASKFDNKFEISDFN